MAKGVLAIIVCYNPELDVLQKQLKAIIPQADKTLIVDNASNEWSEIQTMLDAAFSDDESRLTFLPQTENRGLGAAHNIGINYAIEHDFESVLLLDQDSIPDPQMLAKLSLALEQKSQQQKVSAVGARYQHADGQGDSFFVKFGLLKFQRSNCSSVDNSNCVEADFLISSGTLFAVERFKDIGLMDEDLFIDHVDTEWFLRAKSKGFTAYGVCDALMQHDLGEKTHQIKLGRTRNVPQHKPFRYYYIFRNSVLLYKRGYASLRWKWNDFQRLGMIMVFYGLLVPPRLSNFKMMLLGFWDGLWGITGQRVFNSKS